MPCTVPCLSSELGCFWIIMSLFHNAHIYFFVLGENIIIIFWNSLMSSVCKLIQFLLLVISASCWLHWGSMAAAAPEKHWFVVASMIDLGSHELSSCAGRVSGLCGREKCQQRPVFSLTLSFVLALLLYTRLTFCSWVLQLLSHKCILGSSWCSKHLQSTNRPDMRGCQALRRPQLKAFSG